jgi:hypothetical protein
MWCLQCDNSRIVYYYQCCGCCCYLFDGGEDGDGERRGLGCIALRLLYLPIVLPPSPFSPCYRPGTIPHLVSALWIPFPVPSIRIPSLVPRRVHRGRHGCNSSNSPMYPSSTYCEHSDDNFNCDSTVSLQPLSFLQ